MDTDFFSHNPGPTAACAAFCDFGRYVQPFGLTRRECLTQLPFVCEHGKCTLLLSCNLEHIAVGNVLWKRAKEMGSFKLKLQNGGLVAIFDVPFNYGILLRPLALEIKIHITSPGIS